MGHINPMVALARGLVARGHTATFVAQGDIGPRIARFGLEFCPVGTSTHPPGTLDQMTARLAGTTGLFGIGGVIGDVARTTEMLCREGAEALRRIGAEAIIADQTEPAGGLLARYLDLPQISVANALLINRESLMPPPFVGWPYDDSDWGIKRNRGGYRVADLMMRLVNGVIRRFASEWGLGPIGSIEDCLSPLLQISQTVEGLDFPRREAPRALVHVGPLRDAEADVFEPPDRRQLVFCSLGTLQGARFSVFEAVAQACDALGLSLAIAHGGKLDAGQVRRLPGRPIVEAFLPQRAILAHAAAVATHGGLNTVLDSLSAGVPLIVVPIAFEQSAIAARVERSGAGKSVSLRRLNRRRLETAFAEVIAVPGYRDNAQRLGEESQRAGGVSRAVNLIEAALAMRQPEEAGPGIERRAR